VHSLTPARFAATIGRKRAAFCTAADSSDPASLNLLLDHAPPFPLSHEDIGLGKTHIAHAVFGLVALVGDIVLWRRSRRPTAARI
jgi:hypothetical protein